DGGAGNGLTISDITVNEGDGTATVQVTLTGNVQGGFSVDYQTADGTAIAPDDYTVQSATLTFTGDTGETKEIEVSIADDTLIEPTERLYVNLSNLSTTLIGINDSQGEITIEDNDGGESNGISISDANINENEGTATFIVTLTGNVQGSFTVDFATEDGTAISPDDYIATNGILTFEGTTGETHEIAVTIENDDIAEGAEEFYVNLSNLSSTLINIIDGQGVGYITDPDMQVADDYAIVIDGGPTPIDVLINDIYGPDDGIESLTITNSNDGYVQVSLDSTTTNYTVTYTSNEGFYGLDTFTYTLTVKNSDGSLNSVTATVTIDAILSPSIVDDLAETEANIPIEINVIENDSDPDGTINPESLTIIDEPLNGEVTVNLDGSITYSPDFDFVGDDTFIYQVCDNDGLCNSAQVTVIVAGVLAAELVIPEGFSPNNDQVHDVFEVEGLSNLYPDFEIVIYNRWGVVVYDYHHNGDPLSEPIWWDGYSTGRMTLDKGKQVPVGTYFYTINFNKEGFKSRSGFLYLNR
ncbi:Calx-beta domain-containing protein, partial [Lutibacter sp. B1]|uniref:Calx-beta domain-containing protein n=1 Tax=Lutibacter sp. B1 TaxID=2725996 RepID=UPI0014570FE9